MLWWNSSLSFTICSGLFEFVRSDVFFMMVGRQNRQSGQRKNLFFLFSWMLHDKLVGKDSCKFMNRLEILIIFAHADFGVMKEKTDWFWVRHCCALQVN